MKSIKSVAKELDHSKTKFLQKYGSTEKTIDEKFEERREKIEKMTKSIQTIYKQIMKQDENLKGLSSPLLSLSEVLNLFYEEENSMAIYGNKFREVVMNLDMIIREYSEKQKELYYNFDEYTNKLTALKKKNSEKRRNTFGL